jgi:predicted Zn finger-like uncharacterized protein
MNVSCPSCRARYRVSDDKIKGRGAKITCPKCAHRFVVYRSEDGTPDVGGMDFRTMGLMWKASRGVGLVHEFHDLDGLRELMSDGRVDHHFRITLDGHTWTPLDAVPDLDAWFFERWQAAKRGEIKAVEQPRAEADDEADAPTMIAGRGSSLASEIRQAVSAEATPPPAQHRAPPPPPEQPVPDADDATPAAAPERALDASAPTPSNAPLSGDGVDPAPLEPTPMMVAERREQPAAVRPPSVPAPEARGGCLSWIGMGVVLLGAAAALWA